MLYNLADAADIERLRLKVETDIKRKAVVEYARREQRTGNQNRYLHLVIGVVAMETGNDLQYAKEQYFKRLANPALFVRRTQDAIAGEVEYLVSSRDLTTEQMSEAIDRFKRWAAENGIYIPDQEDAARLQDIEIQMARMRRYL